MTSFYAEQSRPAQSPGCRLACHAGLFSRAALHGFGLSWHLDRRVWALEDRARSFVCRWKSGCFVLLGLGWELLRSARAPFDSGDRCCVPRPWLRNSLDGSGRTESCLGLLYSRLRVYFDQQWAFAAKPAFNEQSPFQTVSRITGRQLQQQA